MFSPSQKGESPLSIEEIELIASSSLPPLEQHHLRLLAHCLACFKAMSGKGQKGHLPAEPVRIEWCVTNPVLKEQKAFIPILLEQLSNAGEQLEAIANELGVTCLELELQDLIDICKIRNQI